MTKLICIVATFIFSAELFAQTTNTVPPASTAPYGTTTPGHSNPNTGPGSPDAGRSGATADQSQQEANRNRNRNRGTQTPYGSGTTSEGMTTTGSGTTNSGSAPAGTVPPSSGSTTR